MAAKICVLVVHGGENLSERLAGIQSRNGSGGAAGDGFRHAVQIIQVVQHQHLHFHNGGLVFTQFLFCFFVQLRQLLPGGFPGRIKLALLQLGVAAGNRQHPLGFAVHHRRANRNAGEYRQSFSLLHGAALPYLASWMTTSALVTSRSTLVWKVG